MNGKMTMLFSEDGLVLELKDEKSGVTFIRARLTSEQTLALMSRQALVDFEFEATGLDKVGKQVYHDTLILEMPKDYPWKDKKSIAEKLAIEHCPEGWQPELYFGSRDSFFNKDGKEFCKTQLMKWQMEE